VELKPIELQGEKGGLFLFGETRDCDSEEHRSDLGISIEDIEEEQRTTLVRFLSQVLNLVAE